MPPARHTRRLELPKSPRRYGFPMTALADTMFQLLVFFMLSANMSAYSLLSVRTGGVAAPGGGEPSGETQPVGNVTRADETVIWSVNVDSLTAGGQRFDLDQVAQLAQSLSVNPDAKVLLIAQQGARVQSLVSVLETLSAHGITSVQVANAPTVAAAPPRTGG